MSLAKLARKTAQTAQAVSDSIRQAFRGKLTLTQSGESIQRVQVQGLADETLQDIEQLQQFGFTSHAPAHTDVIVIPLGGDTSHGIVIASEHGSFRVKNLQSGEVAVYDQSGSSIVLKRGKLIEINCDNLVINASQKVQINSPLTETSTVFTAQGQINGNGGLAISGGSGAVISGSLNATGDISAGAISLQNHTHTEQGDGAPTSTAQ
jgi:bacteriophage Mu gp45 protein